MSREYLISNISSLIISHYLMSISPSHSPASIDDIMSGKVSDNCTTEEWIQLALQEYEQVASLCNAMSILGNVATSLSSTVNYSSTNHGVVGHDDDKRDLDPKVLKREMQHQSLHHSVSSYYEGIDAVRKSHASLKSHLAALYSTADEDDGNNNNQSTRIRRRHPPNIKIAEALTRHVELSERVIRTVMRSSPGQCGVLFDNGLVRPASAGDHEANIVALASLRASVSDLKANFGTT